MKKLYSILFSVLISATVVSQVSKTININTPGTLASLSSSFQGTVTNLTVTGTINRDDFFAMNTYMSKLAVIDLSNVTIVAYSTYMANEIPINAFQNKATLTNVILPNSLTSIGSSAFNGCSGLTDITITNGVNNIGNFAFAKCSSLNNFIVQSNNSFFSTLDGILVDKNQTDLLIYPSGRKGTFTIPDVIKSIGYGAFSNCNNLTEITIPTSITLLGKNCFSNCTSLTNVIIPNSITSITESSFSNCSNLSNISIPNSITSIGKFAFNNCIKLTDISIPNSVTLIDYGAFIRCSGLYKISIPNSVTTLGALSFQNCTGLTSVKIPSTISLIDTYTFDGCIGLKTIYLLNSSPPTLGTKCFNGVSVTDIFVPSDAAVSSYRANSSWSSLFPGTIIKRGLYIDVTSAGTLSTQINISDQNTLENLILTGNIDARDFKFIRDNIPNLNFLDLSWVEIDDYTGTEGTAGLINKNYPVNELPQWAFCNSNTYLGMNKLSTIIFPNSMTSVGRFAFRNCLTLNNMLTQPNNPTYSSSNGILFNKNKSNIVLYPVGKQGPFLIPAGVTTINNYAFNYCNGLTDITIPDYMNSIGIGAFSNCDSLKIINIGTGITTLEDSIFYNCNSITELTIPDNVKTIGKFSFRNCDNLTSIILGKGITSLKDSTFINCKNLNSIYCRSSLPALITKSTFSTNNKIIDVFVPTEIDVTTYKNNLDWYNFFTGNVIKNGFKINVAAPRFLNQLLTLHERNNIQNLTLTGVICAYDFLIMRDSMPSLVNINLKNTSIGTFMGYYGTQRNLNITYSANELPISSFDTRTTMYSGASGKPSIIKSIILPNSLISIGESAFHGCTELKSITLPNSITNIGISAFNSCSQFDSIILPSNLTNIGSGAFSNCTQLKNITLPNSLTNIGSAAFNYCTALSEFIVGANNQNYSSKDGVLLNKNQTILIQYPSKKIGNYIIPNTVTSINSYAFRNSIISKISIPESLNSFSNYAFNSCVIDSMFMSSKTPPTIGYACFLPNPKTVIVYGSALANYKATAGWSTQNLVVAKYGVSIIIELPKLYGESSYNVERALIIAKHSPLDITELTISGEDISAKDFGYISDNLTNLEIFDISNVKIKSYSGMVSTNISGVYLANEIACLGISALSSKLKSINMSNTITGFGYQAFRGCNKLTDFNIPNTVTKIGFYAFSSCTGFTGNLLIPNTVTTIENGAFSNCSGFTGSLSLPNTITTIPSFAFAFCSELSGVLTIPLSVVAINDNAFDGCSKFSKLEINKNTNRIVDYAFNNCVGLQKITIANATPPTIYVNTFAGINKQTCILEVPIGSAAAYKLANFWKTFFTINEKDFNTTTELIDIKDKQVNIYSNHSGIVIEGTIKGEVITLFNTIGLPLKTIISQGDRLQIPVKRQNAYIVKVSSKSKIVIL